VRKAILLGAAGVLLVGATAAWKIQQDIEEEQKGLLAQAAVPAESAERIVLAAFPGATILESEIEEENGRLIYSFELEVAGQRGEVDVEVDAMTGELLPSEVDDDDDDDDDSGSDDDDGPGGGDGRRG
jgi:uncharacterized membrane protein YkoI